LINDGVVDLTYLFDAPGVTLGSIEGSGVFQLATKNLAVGGNNRSTTFSGAILDQGSFPNPLAVGASLTKEGTGTLTLTGTANAYTGATTVNGGTLVVNGSIETSSLVTVNSGGTLAGTGTVGNTAIAGGIFAPGSGTPGSSMSVNGSLGLSPTSTYAVNIDPMTSSFANVTGVATLGGATVNASYAGGSNVSKHYTILTATGGISGTFGVVNSNLPANFTTALSYDSNNAYLDVSFGFAPPPGGFSTNQNNVANAVMNAFNTNGIPLAFGALSPQGLTQVSGEAATGTQQATFDAMSLFMGVMTDPFMAGRGDGIPSSNGAPAFAAEDHDALGYAARGNGRNAAERNAYAAMSRKALPMAPSFEQRWSVWAASYGGSQTTSGNSVVGSNTATSSLYGMALGADYRLSPDTLLGFAMAGGATNFNVAGGLGSGRSDLFQAGAFVHHHIGAAYLSGALAYGWQDVTTDRTVTTGGIERLRANFNANAFSGRLEGGYRIATPLMGITPYAAGQFTTYDLPTYAEQASTGGLLALNYAAKNVTASRSELGFRTDKSFALSDAILTLRSRAAWAHSFDTDRAIAATFQSLPGASFVVNGAQQAREAALLTGSAEMKWANGFALATTFEGEFSDTTSSYAGKGVVRYSW
jgi:autotransporter-associated beta strand protein